MPLEPVAMYRIKDLQLLVGGDAVVRSGLAATFCAAVTAVVLGALVLATLSHDLKILETSTLGEPYPTPYYGFMPAIGTSATPGAPGAAGADFSQVYTSAAALRHGQSAYFPVDRRLGDRYGRIPGYPPLMNRLWVPLAGMPYRQALLVHTVSSFLALLAAGAFVLWKTGLRRHIWRVSLLSTCLYFLTPIGVGHLERGQFDLLVATSYVLCSGCVLLGGSRWGMAGLSGFIAALKWTAAPFLGCFSALGFLLCSHRKRAMFLLVPFVWLLATAIYFRELPEYWATVRIYDLNAQPGGLTLRYFLSPLMTKVAPFGVTALIGGLAFMGGPSKEDRLHTLVSISAPFALAIMTLAVCFVTLSYEYHTVTMLGMLPGYVIWVERARFVSQATKALVGVVYGVLLVVGFRIFGLRELLNARDMTAAYATATLVFMCISTYIIVALAGTRRRSQAPLPVES